MFGNRRVGPCDQDRPLGFLRARRPHLLPVDDPVVAVAHRAGGNPGQVGSSTRLAEQLAVEVLSGEQRPQELSLLLRGAEGGDSRRRHAHPDAVVWSASRRRARRGQLVFDLRLKAARQVEPAGAAREVHPGQSRIEPGSQEFTCIARRIVLVQQRPHPSVQILRNRLLVDAHRNSAALPST